MNRTHALTLAALLLLPLPSLAEDGNDSSGGYGIRIDPNGGLSIRGANGEGGLDLSLQGGKIRIRAGDAEGSADIRIGADGVNVRAAGAEGGANVRVTGSGVTVRGLGLDAGADVRVTEGGVDVKAHGGGETARVHVGEDGSVQVSGGNGKTVGASSSGKAGTKNAGPGLVSRILGGVASLLGSLFGGN